MYFLSIIVYGQIPQEFDYANPKEYELGGITFNGSENLNKNTLINISGLEVGKKIIVPGDNISKAINNLWNQCLFEEIDITIEKIIENIVFLNINLKVHYRLSKFKFKGKISKSDITTLKEDLKLIRGDILSQNLINNSINTIKKYYIEKGFYNVNVNLDVKLIFKVVF